MKINVYYFFICLCLGNLSIHAQSGTLRQEPINHITSETYDIKGKVMAKSRIYFDKLGKQTQSQSWDSKTKKVWATQTLYDEQGRPTLSTSAAPIGSNFKYKSNFILDANGAVFNTADLGTITRDPSTVKNTANTLGAYYSTRNTTEKYQDITDRPYSRTFYDELNPGKILKTVGGNKVDTNSDGTPDDFPQGFSHALPAAQELYYAFGKEQFFKITNNNNSSFSGKSIFNGWITKNVSIDAHGIENVSFVSEEGLVLATARSGGASSTKKKVLSLIGDEGYVDIHLPKGCERSLKFLGSANQYEVFNLRTGKKLTSNTNLPAGVYRIAIVNRKQKYSNLITIQSNGSIVAFANPSNPSKGVYYDISYYDYSLNYYDDAGNLKSSLPAIGFDNKVYANYNLTGTVSHIKESLKSHFKYNGLGQIIYTKSPDAGEAWFKYRKDGQIRFSQNSKQKTAKEFSYTHYDRLGRPVESGIYKENATYRFDNSGSKSLDNILDKIYTFDQYANDNDALKNSYCSEQYFTQFDVADNEELKRAFGNDPRASKYRYQNFIEGAVAKSYSQKPNTTTTWYSYDIYGRITWVVQQIDGLDDLKTIDYVYDDITSDIHKVYYQKGVRGEEFIHRYTYDSDDYSLTKVETTTNEVVPYTEHATYSYYETGALKRINLAKGLQGIDYVYNLNGSLKAINHPSLEAAKDPGGDANDVFGMMIDYYNGDYKRKGLHINTALTGIDRYNGNIKGIRWKNSAIDDPSAPPQNYTYIYNRNNWLNVAAYGTESDTPADMIANNSVNTKHISDYLVANVNYDANGNIKSLMRNKHTENGSNAMDQLTYVYKQDKPNQLLRVEDAVTTNTNANDIKTQTGSNYVYNSIGQLVKNNSENIEYAYNANGLVSEVIRNQKPLVKFYYNDRNQRLKKESYDLSNGRLNYTEHYVRDASGTPMAIYRNGRATEHTIYGNGRLGVFKRIGENSLYEIKDHLGNVRAVIGRDNSARKLPITNATDYYPFGTPLPNRNVQGDYRYAFQGQEKDPETGKEAFELRLWDARIGRWLTTDPAGQYASPYLGMGNNPVSRIDPDGGMDEQAAGPIEEVVVTGSSNDFNFNVSYWDSFGYYWNLRRDQINDLALNAVDYYIDKDIPYLSALGGTLASTLLYENQLNTILSLSGGGGAGKAIYGAGSKIVGTAQSTGTRGHALVSDFIGTLYAFNPRVSRVTFDLGYKRLLGGGSFRYGPRPDVGVLFGSGNLKAFEVASKTDVTRKLLKKNNDFMKRNNIEGTTVVTDVAKFLNKIWPK